jgi:hypothetical protein
LVAIRVAWLAISHAVILAAMVATSLVTRIITV